MNEHRSTQTRTRRGRRRLARAAVVAAAVAAGAGMVAPATAEAVAIPHVSMDSYDARMLADLNYVRALHGLPALRPVPGATDVAHGWSCVMADDGDISHRPDLVPAVATHGSPAWQTMGENVGMTRADDPDVLFNAYLASPHHRANILDPAYRYVGIHTKMSGGVAYNVFDFVDSYSPSTYGLTHATC